MILKKVWLIGTKTKKLDRSIGWEEPLPNLSEADVLIINLQTYLPDVVKRIDKKALTNARDEIIEKFLSGGMIVFITGLDDKQYVGGFRYDRYYFSPLKIQVTDVREGNDIKYEQDNPLSKYLENVRKFSYYLHDIEIDTNLKLQRGTTNRIAAILEVINKEGMKIDELTDYQVTDNSGHILCSAYRLYLEPTYKSGIVIYLQPPTELSLEEVIEFVLEGLHVTTKVEDFPPWTNEIKFPALEKSLDSLKTLQQEKNLLEAKLSSIQNERDYLKSFFGLLSAKGTHLENLVQAAFKLIGFDDVQKIRDSGHEDWTFEFKSNRKYKYGVIEVHGSDSRSSLAKLVQCNKWVDEYFDRQSLLCKGIFVANQYRLEKYPPSKLKRLKFEPNELDYANRRDICIIPSCILFDAVVSSFENPKLRRDNLEEKILNSNGILTEL